MLIYCVNKCFNDDRCGCNLLALVLNIPHLGCDRPSDPANWTQPNVWSDPSVPGAHSDNNCVLHFLCPMWGLHHCV